MNKRMIVAVLGTAVLIAGGCEDKKTGDNNKPPQNTPPSTQAEAPKPHGRLALGETTVGALKLVATMDEPISAAGGGEGAFDLVITGGKPKAVRFWIGVESGEGSVKAKAEEETTDNWHTHAEAPKPLPKGSKFWAEVEPPSGATFKLSFNLKTR